MGGGFKNLISCFFMFYAISQIFRVVDGLLVVGVFLSKISVHVFFMFYAISNIFGIQNISGGGGGPRKIKYLFLVVKNKKYNFMFCKG